MSSIKTVSVVLIAVIILAACQRTTPTRTIGLSNTFTESIGQSSTATQTKGLSHTSVLESVPYFKTSFEDITDVAARGITSPDNSVNIDTENVYDYSGRQDLEIDGQLPGSQYSYLSADLSLKKLAGKDSVDFSNKTLYISAMVPADSPIDDVSIYAGKGNDIVLLAAILFGGDNNYEKGIWQDFIFNLDESGITNPNTLSWQNLTPEQALDIASHCEYLRIMGSRLEAGGQVESGFYVDDLRWIGNDFANLPVDRTVDSLRKYAENQHFKLGFFTNELFMLGFNYPWYDPWYAYTAAQEGGTTSVRSFLQFEPKDPALQQMAAGDFNPIRPEDNAMIQLYDFGKKYGSFFYGYGPGSMDWNAPLWGSEMNLAFPGSLEELLSYYVEKDLRYSQGGPGVIWALFNEPLRNNGKFKNRQGIMNEGTYYPWISGDDTSLVDAAFRKAKQVNPNALLIINDNDVEQIGDFEGCLRCVKSEALFKWVSDMKQRGIPIDGVGFQLAHPISPDSKVLTWQFGDTNMSDDLANVDRNVKRYAALGLKVAFTEIFAPIKIDDIDMHTPEGRTEYDRRLQIQANYYGGLMEIALENENVILYHIWVVSDYYHDGMIDGYRNSSILDKNYDPKPAYYTLLNLLKGN